MLTKISASRSCPSSIIGFGTIVSRRIARGPNFTRAHFCVAIVVGDYLYIDGGEVTTWNGEGNGLQYRYSYFTDDGDINTTPGTLRGCHRPILPGSSDTLQNHTHFQSISPHHGPTRLYRSTPSTRRLPSSYEKRYGQTLVESSSTPTMVALVIRPKAIQPTTRINFGSSVRAIVLVSGL